MDNEKDESAGWFTVLELWVYASRRALLSKHHKHTRGNAE